MRDAILDVLFDQNPWWRDPSARCSRKFPHRRREFDILQERMNSDVRRARLLLGPRAVGKTVLLQQWIDHLLNGGVPGSSIIYIDLDEPRFPPQVSLEQIQRLALEAQASASHFPRYFIIDEIHHSPRWAQWLRRQVDRTTDQYLVTDSASALLADGSVETGQGRFDEIRMGYLSFRDFYVLQQAPAQQPGAGMVNFDLDPLRAAQSAEDYLALGGFPAHVHSRDRREVRRLIRQDIEEKAIIKDLGMLRAGDVDLLRELFVALVEASGSEFNAQQWSQSLAQASTRQRISEGLRLLESTFLVGRLPRYGRSRRAELSGHPKIYAMDPALVTAFSRDPDSSLVLGRAVETAVFCHLHDRASVEGASLSFYKGKKECDFVLAIGGSLMLIEVEASRRLGSDKALNLSAISEDLKRVEKLIGVTRGSAELRHSIHGKEIHEIPLWAFLDRISRHGLQELLK